MLNIQKLAGPQGQALMGLQLAEVVEVVALLRSFKQQYPREWRQVNYEIISSVGPATTVTESNGQAAEPTAERIVTAA